MVEIEPVSALLEPGESCMCKVSFTATGEPSFYDLDVICEVRYHLEQNPRGHGNNAR